MPSPPRKRDQTKATFLASTPTPKNLPPDEASYKKNAERLPIAKYDSMYQAYCERQQIAYVARVVGVTENTARRYVLHGDPQRKLPAIKARWESTVQRAQAAEDYTLIKERREVQTVGRVMLQKIAAAAAALDPAKLDPNRLPAALREIQATLERTLGQADTTVAVQGGDEFRGWTDEELDLFFTQGIRPMHARGTAGAAISAAARRKSAEGE